jgi:RNA polymerase sigma-70 factor (ECF subfamily)
MSKATRPIDHEELLSHVARLRGLARRLVLDESRADDVVQQGMLAAIEKPPREGVAFGPWLVGVVRNLARRTHRADSRRARHEAAAAQRAGAAGPDEIAAQSEAFRDLADAVHRLDPLYRDVVVLHYFDGLEVRAVAERLGAPVETVRTRLKRALAQLRERLDAKHGGDGRTWAAALLPFAAGGGGVTAPALVQGGLVMTAKTKAALALAAVILVALTISVALLGGRDEPPPVETAAVPAPRPTPVAVVEERAPPPPAPEPPKTAVAAALVPVVAPPAPRPVAAAPKPAPVVVVEPVGTGTVVGAVRVASTRKAVAGKRLTIEALGATTLTVSTDAQGRFRFEHLAENRAWRVRVEADGFAPAVVPNLHLDRDEVRDVGTLWLDVPVPLAVVVKDWRDRPIAGATVEAEPAFFWGISDAWTHAIPFRHVREAVASVTTGADGRAALATLPPGDWVVVARAAGFASAWDWHVTLAAGTTKREVTLRLDRAQRIEGRVVAGDGRPVPRVVVWASGDKWLVIGPFVFAHTTTDDAGAFVLDGVQPGDTKLLVGRDGAVPSEVMSVRVPTSGRVEIVLDGGIVEGRVTSASDGTPVAGARVLAWMVGDPGMWFVDATTGDDGRYRLDTVRAGRAMSFRVERQGFLTAIEATPEPLRTTPEIRFGSGPVTHDFALRRGVALAGRVSSTDGPVAGARVIANWREKYANGSSFMRTEGFTDGDGRFALTGVAPGTVVVQVTADGWYQEGLADFQWDIALLKGRKPAHAIDVPAAGLSDVKIELTRGCVVSGRVESASGAPVAGATVSCVWTTTTTRDDGTFSLTAAVTGQTAWVSAGSATAWNSQTIELTPAGSIDGLVLRLPRTVRVSGRVSTTTGGAVDGASVEVVFRPAKVQYDQREWTAARVPVVDGGRYEAEFAESEGRFLVRASAPGFATTDSPDSAVETGRATYTADVVLATPRSLDGCVVSSADGRTPIAGARVALLPGSWEVRPQDRRVVALAAVTDRDGRFRVLDVAAGDTFVDVDAAGFVHSITPVKFPADGELVVKVEPSQEIAGVVKLEDGSAVPNVWVGVRREHDDRRDNWWSVPTGDDGRFRVTGVPRGAYTVSVNAFEALGSTVSVRPSETTGVPSGKTDLEIVLRSAGEIAGRVLAPDGRPLAGCGVQAFSETGERYTPYATTKDDGTFVIRGIGDGTYRLEAKPPEAERTGYVSVGAQLRAAKATGVSAGAKNVDIRLTGGLTIRGVLLDARGAPLANAWIRAEPLPGQNLDPAQDSWLFGPGAQTDAAGKFTIGGLATARYRLLLVPDPQRIDVRRPLKGGEDVGAGATNVRVLATE